MTLSAEGIRGRTVLLTGAGRKGQAGEAVATALGAAGASLILIARTVESAQERVEELRATGVSARAFACDLTDATALSNVVTQIAPDLPNGLHALVHLAGGFAVSGPVAGSDDAIWHQQLAINLTTAYLTTRAVLPLLRKGMGSIVYFASAVALPGAAVSELSAYAAAKSGLIALMRAVAAEERPHGVRANALAPTVIRTATNVASMGEHARFVEREIVANWVLHLIDAASGPVTGQVIKLG